jgi:hypothetical protein
VAATAAQFLDSESSYSESPSAISPVSEENREDDCSLFDTECTGESLDWDSVFDTSILIDKSVEPKSASSSTDSSTGSTSSVSTESSPGISATTISNRQEYAIDVPALVLEKQQIPTYGARRHYDGCSDWSGIAMGIASVE